MDVTVTGRVHASSPISGRGACGKSSNVVGFAEFSGCVGPGTKKPDRTLLRGPVSCESVESRNLYLNDGVAADCPRLHRPIGTEA